MGAGNNTGMGSKALEREKAAFYRELPRLLKTRGNRGRWALVHGDEVAGIYPNFDACLEAGYERFGLSPFLIMEVAEKQKVISMTTFRLTPESMRLLQEGP